MASCFRNFVIVFTQKVKSRRLIFCCLQTSFVLFIIICVLVPLDLRSGLWPRNESTENQEEAEEVPEVKPMMDVENDVNSPTTGVDALRLKIERANHDQIVYNDGVFGPMTNDSVVLVVQVHNRPQYLKYLIKSLSKAKYIDQALLIFSHDLVSEEINELVRSITFCKVMQIFFPYSIETHPDTFPGDDPRDCPRDIGMKKAKEMQCQNADHPDTYGHYREAKIAQIKHHWWWKLNHVFNSLNMTATYNGPVVFLEEDHYLVEDFIHLLRLMYETCGEEIDCHFMGLGLNELLSSIIHQQSNAIRLLAMNTNLGLTFNRISYLDFIKSCAKEFCGYDDYNWDWSFNYITNHCNKKRKLAMVPAVPRIFHIGECGTHIHKTDCDAKDIVSRFEDTAKKFELYPSDLKVLSSRANAAKFTKSGGWGDSRDQELCMNMTRS